VNEGRAFDVVVIGAGPAGAMAAQYAAKGGLRVALLERKKDVGTPVRCGEAVGLKGMSISIDIEDRWIQTTIKKMSMISPSGHRVTFDIKGKDESYIINREIMDKDLVQYAVDAGAFYFPRTPVTSVAAVAVGKYKCLSPEKEFYARCLILADGVESKCARDLGWNTALSMEDIETCAFCRVEHESIIEDSVELFTGSAIAPGGFLWVFPRSKGKANVGLGVLGTNSSSGRVKQLLNSFTNEKFPGARITDIHCGGVPVGKWLRPLVKDGVLIVGDAARQVNSLNGGGIV
jgi:digeranylgeranylglycerophospholipid reductase